MKEDVLARNGIPVLITRPLKPEDKALAHRLGLHPICRPVLRFEYQEEWKDIRLQWQQFDADALAFTSRHGVEGFRRFTLQIPVEATRMPCYAVGPGTGETLSKAGLDARIPGEHNGLALARMIIKDRLSSRVAWFCGDRRRKAFQDHLHSKGLAVLPVVVYRTAAEASPMDLDGIRAVVFYSPGTVEAFLDENPVPDLPAFAIGPVTAAALRDAGFPEIHTSDDARTATLLYSVAGYLGKQAEHSPRKF